MSRSCGGEALRAVDQEHDASASAIACARLLRHLVQDAVLRHRLEAAGVDDEERPVADAARGRSGGRA